METKKTENADEELLGELSRTAAMGVEAMELVISKARTAHCAANWNGRNKATASLRIAQET